MDQEPTATPLRPPLSNTRSPREGEPDPSDVERLQKWQQERIARKLRGEYESYVLHLSELVKSNFSAPFRIASVRVEGAHNTRRSFLGSLIRPFFFAPEASPTLEDHEQTLESVFHTARNIARRLQETNIFKSVEVGLARSREPLSHEDDIDIVFHTREKGRFYLKTATEVGNGEGTASVTGQVRNVFGGAETLEAHMSLGTTTRRSFNAIFSTPLTHDLRTRGDLSVFGIERDNTAFASSMEGLQGIRAEVRNGTMASGLHTLAYEAVVRHVTGLTPKASFSIREAAGRTLKSSLSHSWRCDTRDDRVAGSSGVYTKLLHELAGLGGDASFYKIEAESQLSRGLFPGTTYSLSVRTGFLWPFRNKTSLFSDRFQLGGPTSIRSFKINGLGPHDGPDALGGDLYWGTGLSLISDVPRKAHWPVKLHLFLNAGRLDAIDKSRSVGDNIIGCFSRPSISAGAGLIYRFDPVRVEMNFGLPLVASKSDQMRRGVQVGMGLEFL